jgi:hypothetical protein
MDCGVFESKFGLTAPIAILDVRLVGQTILFSITFHVSFPGIILVSVLAAAAAVWIPLPKLRGLYFLY